MRITVSTNNIAALRARVEQMRAELPFLLQQAVQEVGESVVADLSEAAPIGTTSGGGTAPAGESEGPLANSFFARLSESADGSATIVVRTSQPTKLGYVRGGTGIYGPTGQRIRPTRKKALFWPDADHPVKSVAGMKPNDFVTPVLDGAPDAQEAMQPVFDALTAIWEGA